MDSVLKFIIVLLILTKIIIPIFILLDLLLLYHLQYSSPLIDLELFHKMCEEFYKGENSKIHEGTLDSSLYYIGSIEETGMPNIDIKL